MHSVTRPLWHVTHNAFDMWHTMLLTCDHNDVDMWHTMLLTCDTQCFWHVTHNAIDMWPLCCWHVTTQHCDMWPHNLVTCDTQCFWHVTHTPLWHVTTTISHTLFSYHSKKIDSLFFEYFLRQRSIIYDYEQICPVPSALMHSMQPLANPFAALLIHVPRPPAALATRHSFAAMTSLFLSACSATHNSHIHKFSV